MLHFARTGGILLALTGAAFGQDVIDFEGLPAGTILDQVYSAGGVGPILVAGMSPAFPGQNVCLIFDSANPSGTDFDLGTPNEQFGGPGVGAGGEMGSPFENSMALGNVAIIAENLVDMNGDGLVDDPDDGDELNSLIMFDFGTNVGPVTIDAITLIDVEADELQATVDMYDGAMTLISQVLLPQLADNGVATIALGGVSGVSTMVVSLHGSGAIDNLVFSVPCTGLVGDFVWNDLNADGLQDLGEPGIEGVRLTLCDPMGNELGETFTDDMGAYLFTGLCAGTYVVKVDESTLPMDFVPSPCNVGTDDTIDNDCSPCMAVLPMDDSEDRDCDFGYNVPDVPGGGEGCTPGYWKQPQHFKDWPETVSPGDLFSMYFEDAFPNMNLLQVLKQGGGGLKALGRHTVAAWLNAQNDEVSFGLSANDVVDMFNALYPANTKQEYNALKDIFADLNEEGCPLNNGSGGGSGGGLNNGTGGGSGGGNKGRGSKSTTPSVLK